MADKNDILQFWFSECTPEHWFKKEVEFDALIRARFGDDVEQALMGEFDGWADEADGCLALLLMLDQFTRNIFRNRPRAFAGDEKALKFCLEGQKRGYLDQLEDRDHRHFLLMPMMHSEDLSIQEASLALFKKYTAEETYGPAVRHRDIIAKFGRFPHRNAILGRKSTTEELSFLETPGSSF